jgi:tetratricopeptide (TPR) repeat protein
MAKRPKRAKAARSDVSQTAPAAGAGLSSSWTGGLILVLAIFLTYLPVWHAGFIWDDDGHVTRPDLRSWAGLGRIWFQLGATQQYYPVVHSVFWVEHGLWGDAPLGYHLVNVLLYALSALVLLKVLRQLEIPGAWLATAIFALHPVQVESVAWVTELKNVLSGLFYFSSALAYLQFDRTRETKVYAGSLALFVLGLMSKSVIASLPAALLVVFWWKRGRLSWKADVLPLIPFFAVGIVCGLFTAWVERHFIGAEGAAFDFTFLERTLIAGHAIWFYLGNLAWPTNLIFNYPRWHIDGNDASQYLFPGAALVVAAGLAWLSRTWRGPLAGFLFFVGTLFPALGFFNVYPFIYSFVADHFQYLACLGIIVPAAAGLTRLAEILLPGKARLQAMVGAALLLLLGSLSWEQAWVYANEKMLWTETLEQNPESWLAHNNLGIMLLHEARPDEAIAQFRKTLELNPNFDRAHDSIGDALLQKGQVEAALAEYQKCMAAEPNFASSHFNAGLCLAMGGRTDDAIAEFRKTLALDPYHGKAHYNLGTALLQKGQVNEAIVQFQECLAVEPGEPHALEKLAQAEAMAQPEQSPK